MNRVCSRVRSWGLRLKFVTFCGCKWYLKVKSVITHATAYATENLIAIYGTVDVSRGRQLTQKSELNDLKHAFKK